jgi:putative Mg2+ transporter-C (MgtC) family protein
VLTGVGFIGAGVVLRDIKTQEVYGLTTAAAVWLTAALGIAAGLGAWRAVFTGAVVGIILLAAIQSVEGWFGLRKAQPNGNDAAAGSRSRGSAEEEDVGPNGTRE